MTVYECSGIKINPRFRLLRELFCISHPPPVSFDIKKTFLKLSGCISFFKPAKNHFLVNRFLNDHDP